MGGISGDHVSKSLGLDNGDIIQNSLVDVEIGGQSIPNISQLLVILLLIIHASPCFLVSGNTGAEMEEEIMLLYKNTPEEIYLDLLWIVFLDDALGGSLNSLSSNFSL